MKTETGNKLIADFMGKPDHIMPELLKYHSSWNWLMPVVEKISKHKYSSELLEPTDYRYKNVAYPRTFGMPSPENGRPLVRFNRMGLHEADTLMEATWLACVDFINSNKS